MSAKILLFLKDCRGATGLAVRSLMQAAKFLFHEQSQARPDEGEKACERTPLSRLLALYRLTEAVNALRTIAVNPRVVGDKRQDKCVSKCIILLVI